MLRDLEGVDLMATRWAGLWLVGFAARSVAGEKERGGTQNRDGSLRLTPTAFQIRLGPQRQMKSF